MRHHTKSVTALPHLPATLRALIEAGAAVVEVLLDSADDIPAADAMFAIMCDAPGALAGTQPSLLLRTALLTNKYDARMPLAAAVDELLAEPLDDAALQLFWQLPGCWEPPFWPLLLQAIQHKLASAEAGRVNDVTELLLYVCDCDLESVWTDSSGFRRALLMELSTGVLAALLSCRDLRVASEDTVLLTVAKRVERLKQLGRAESAIQQERKQLMGAVRMLQLTPAALTFIAPKLPWISQQQCTTPPSCGTAGCASGTSIASRPPHCGLVARTSPPPRPHTPWSLTAAWQHSSRPAAVRWHPRTWGATASGR